MPHQRGKAERVNSSWFQHGTMMEATMSFADRSMSSFSADGMIDDSGWTCKNSAAALRARFLSSSASICDICGQSYSSTGFLWPGSIDRTAPLQNG